MPINTVIFDLDGTLLNTIEDIAEATNRTLLFYGMPTHRTECYRQFIGDGLRTLIKRATPENTPEEHIDLYCRDFLRIYGQCWDKSTQPYNGIAEVLTKMQRKQIIMAVLSNKPHDFVVKCVEKFFPIHTFATVLGQREGQPKKPDPSGALEILSSLGKSAQEAVFVGDSPIDIKTGKAAGMSTIAVVWGFCNRSDLEKEVPTYLIDSPLELEHYVIALS